MKHLIFIACVLLVALPVSAQDEVTTSLMRKLEENRIKFPAMRPQVFFSQDKYTPGDTAFFRLFILTEAEQNLAERSLLSLELVDPSGRPVARQVISCQRFGAANQLILPDSLSPGFYEVRIFSDRMTLAYGLSTHLLIVGERQLVRQPRTQDELVFYPEGGHLVEGALNRVVVRAMGPVPESAALFSGEERVMTINFDESGLAEMQFIPLRDKVYRFWYTINGKAQTVAVPSTEPDAVSFRVYRGPKQMWVLDMTTGPKGPRSATMVLVADRQINSAREIKFKSDRANILASAGFFPEGFSELFLVDADGKVLAYRPMYVVPKAQAQVEFTGIPESVALRQEVSALLKLTDAEGKPVVAQLAISVVPDEVRARAIRTPDPTLELRTAQPTFDWSQPVARTDREIIAAPIPESVIAQYPPLVHRANLGLSGKVQSTDPSSTLPYLSRMLIYLHNDKIQYETPIDGSGNFEFEKIYDFMGSDKVFYKVMNKGKRVPHVRVDWTSDARDFAPQPADHYAESSEPDTYGQLRKKKRAVDHSFRYFLSGDSSYTPIGNYNAMLEREFRDPDISINPGEYVPFETMQELILEVVPSLKFRARSKDSLLQVDLQTFSPFVPMRYAEGSALCIVDGYMTSNINYVMSLSPRDIMHIKIILDIGKLDRLDNLAKDGIVFIQTRIPERTRRDLGKELEEIAGLSPTIPVAVRHPTQPRVPDLRSMLYWTPLSDTDTTGNVSFKFRTSDMPGAYWVRVMGTTANGHLVTAEHRFVVNFK